MAGEAAGRGSGGGTVDVLRAPFLRPVAERIAGDAYYTPAPAARAIVSRLAQLVPEPRDVCEPHVGGFAFAGAALETWPRSELTALDVNWSAAYRALLRGARWAQAWDWLRPELPGRSPHAFDLILGNPPYLGVQDHIEAGLRRLRPHGCLVFLLRLGVLGGSGRAESLWASPGFRYLMPVAPRPSFTTDGNGDSSEYGVFVWQRGWAGLAQVLRPCIWKKEGKRNGNRLGTDGHLATDAPEEHRAREAPGGASSLELPSPALDVG